MENTSRPFYAALVVLALALLGYGLKAAQAEGLAFGLFAFLVIGGGLVCIWERSVVRSAFSLLATFSGVSGLFVLLGADFLAVAQILIYVGGILALLLFGVMLTPPDMGERKLARVLGGLGAVGAGAMWVAMQVGKSANWIVDPELAEVSSRPEQIGVGFLAVNFENGDPGYVVAFELAAVVLTVALVAAVYIARRKKSDLEETGVEGGNS
jgi:NADH-quinone oxidoreductase subunit J